MPAKNNQLISDITQMIEEGSDYYWKKDKKLLLSPEELFRDATSLSKKESDLQYMIIKYEQAWTRLPCRGNMITQIAGMELPFKADYANILVSGAKVRKFINKKPSKEDLGIATGCVNAMENTYIALLNALFHIGKTEWKVSRIKLRVGVHYAVAVYDNNIGDDQTYVFDPWLEQCPVVYKWNEWIYHNRSIVITY